MHEWVEVIWQCKNYYCVQRSLDQEEVSLWNLVVALLQGISLLSLESQLSITLITLSYTFSSQTQHSTLKFQPFSSCKNSTFWYFSLSETRLDEILNGLWSSSSFRGCTFRGRYCLKGLDCSSFSQMKAAVFSLNTRPIQNVVCISPIDPKWLQTWKKKKVEIEVSEKPNPRPTCLI
jgi:hypothetical protein